MHSSYNTVPLSTSNDLLLLVPDTPFLGLLDDHGTTAMTPVTARTVASSTISPRAQIQMSRRNNLIRADSQSNRHIRRLLNEYLPIFILQDYRLVTSIAQDTCEWISV